jgi:hypothetical protein
MRPRVGGLPYCSSVTNCFKETKGKKSTIEGTPAGSVILPLRSGCQQDPEPETVTCSPAQVPGSADE